VSKKTEIFKYAIVANLPLSLSVKKIENRLTFGEVMGKSLVSCFLTHSVLCTNEVRQKKRKDAANLLENLPMKEF